MKRKIAAVIGAIMLCATCSGCGQLTNAQLMDTTFYFSRAQIKMPDGSYVEGKVDSWKDYEDSEAIQIVIDGTTYYTLLSNVVLIKD